MLVAVIEVLNKKTFESFVKLNEVPEVEKKTNTIIIFPKELKL